jgi:SAM-dependent methyltransferase
MALILKNLSKIRQRGFAALYDKVTAGMEPKLALFREQTAGKAMGHVLEIGGGTGANLPFFRHDAHLKVYEPNPYMAKRLVQKARAAERDLTVVTESSGGLPFDDASFDSVVSTLVLCSVPRLADEIQEIRRVLKAGGAFYFFEHVASPDPWTRRFQDWLNSPRKLFANGCNLNRDIGAAINSGGFSLAELSTVGMDLGDPLIKDAVIGVAWA